MSTFSARTFRALGHPLRAALGLALVAQAIFGTAAPALALDQEKQPVGTGRFVSAKMTGPGGQVIYQLPAVNELAGWAPKGVSPDALFPNRGAQFTNGLSGGAKDISNVFQKSSPSETFKQMTGRYPKVEEVFPFQKTGKLTHEQALEAAKNYKIQHLEGTGGEELEILTRENDKAKQDCSDLNQKSEGPKKAPTKAPTTTCSNGRCTVTQHNETQKSCTWQIDEKTGECVCKENSSSSSTSPGSNGGDCSNGSCGGDGGGGGGALGKLGGLGGMAGMLGGLAGMGGQNQGQGGAGQLTAEQLAAQQKEKDTYEKQIADLQKRVALAEEEAKAKEEAKAREEAKLAAAATAAAEEEAALGDEKVAQEVKGAENPTVPETAIPIEIPSTTGSSTTSSQLESQLFAPVELRM